MNDRRKEVHTRDYDGPDRRGEQPARRTTDLIANNLKLSAVGLGIAISIFSAGGGWMAANKAIDSKVSQSDFDRKNAQQDHDREVLANRQDRLEELIIKQVIPKLEKMDGRLTAIYCFGKPPGCQ